MKLMTYNGQNVITVENLREYVKFPDYKSKKRVVDIIISKLKNEGKTIFIPSDKARKYGQKKGFNYARGLNLIPVDILVEHFKNDSYYKKNIDTNEFISDVEIGIIRGIDEKITQKEKQIESSNVEGMPFDEVYALMDRMSEIYSIRLEKTEQKLEEFNAKFDEVLKKLDELNVSPIIPVEPVEQTSVFNPIILKEDCSYADWSKGIHKAVDLIKEITKKPESEIFHEAYSRIRTQYGIVWEQESKEFKEEFGRGPVNTRELCWWLETNKKNYKNLLIGKLNTMFSEAKRKVE